VSNTETSNLTGIVHVERRGNGKNAAATAAAAVSSKKKAIVVFKQFGVRLPRKHLDNLVSEYLALGKFLYNQGPSRPSPTSQESGTVHFVTTDTYRVTGKENILSCTDQ
jgi:hypothetical protein